MLAQIAKKVIFYRLFENYPLKVKLFQQNNE